MEDIKFDAKNVLSRLLVQTADSGQVRRVDKQKRKLDRRQFPELLPLDFCPLSNEEIETHSLVDQLACRLPNQVSDPKHVIKLLTNFLGGGLLTGGSKCNQLDGTTWEGDLLIWKRLMAALFKDVGNAEADGGLATLQRFEGVIAQLDEWTERMETLQMKANNREALVAEAKRYSDEIRALQAGQSRIMGGGWANQGTFGHALVYEFERREDDNYDVYAYTSTGYPTAGTDRVGDKLRQRPVVLYQGVPEGVLLTQSEDGEHFGLIHALIELEVLPVWKAGDEVKLKHVLARFDCLEDYRVPLSIDYFGALTGQRGGTCGPSVTKAILRRHSGHLGYYKQAIFHLKLRLLVAGYHHLQKVVNSESSQQKAVLSRRLLGQLARRLHRWVAKRGTECAGLGPLISPKLAQAAQATAWDLMRRVEAAEKNAKRAARATLVRSDLSAADVGTQRRARQRQSFPVDQERSVDSLKAKALPALAKRDLAKADGDAVVQFLTGAVEKCKTLIKSDQDGWSLAVAEEIHSALDLLPLPILSQKKVARGTPPFKRFTSPLWDRFDDKTIQRCQEQLVELARMFTYVSEDVRVPRLYTSIFSFQALGHFLALKAESHRGLKDPSSSLGYYGLVDKTSLVEKTVGLIFFDQREHKRLRAAQEYLRVFQECKTHGILFEQETSCEVVNGQLTSMASHADLINGTYWERLLESDDSLRKAIDAKVNERWPDLTEREIDENYQKKYRAYEDKLAEYRKDYAAWVERCAKIRQKEEGERRKQSYRRHKRPPAPGEPSQPTREVNLSLQTKRTLYLEEISVIAKGTLLHQNGHGHIGGFRRMNVLVDYLLNRMGPLDQKDFPQIRPGRRSPYSVKGYTTATYRGCDVRREKDPHTSRALSTQHKQDFKGNYEHFFDQRQARRDVRLWEVDRAEVLALPQKFGGNVFLQRLLRIASEWRLAPIQLIHECNRNPMVLKESQNRSTFMRLFFRSPVVEQKSELGVGALILTDSALHEAAVRFTNAGLVRAEKDENHLETALFYLEFSYHLGYYLRQAADAATNEQEKSHLEKLVSDLNQTNAIDKWLEKPFVQRESAALELYRMLHLSLQCPEDKKEQATWLANVYASWTGYSVHARQCGLISPPIKVRTEEWICRLTASLRNELKRNQPLLQEVCDTVADRLSLDRTGENGKWTVDEDSYPICRVDCDDLWEIDLGSGRVSSKAGLLGEIDPSRPWERKGDFPRLFGTNPGFDYRSIGSGIIAFEDKKIGPVRLYRSGYNWRIRCQFNTDGLGKRWFELRTLSARSGFPQALIDDHTFWVPVQDGPKGVVGFIATLDRHERCFRVNSSGTIEEVEPKKGITTPESHLVDSLETDHPHAFGRFDPKGSLLYGHSKGGFTRLDFPRYRSQQGNPLRFVHHKGQWVWDDNRLYRAPDGMPSGCLGTITNYLYLEASDKKMEDKILVPFQPIEAERAPWPNGDLAVDKRSPPLAIDAKEGPKNEQKDLYRYFVYNVDGEDGSLKPATTEGRLFLAYVHLSQKRFAEAIELIRGGRHGDRLSPMSLHILAMIGEFELGDDDSEGPMVKLHALYVAFEQKDQVATEEVTSYFANDAALRIAMDDFCSWVGAQNHVSAACRFSRKEEGHLLELMQKEGKRLYVPFRDELQRRQRILCGGLPDNEAMPGRRPAVKERRSFPNSISLVQKKPSGCPFTDCAGCRSSRKLVEWENNLGYRLSWWRDAQKPSYYLNLSGRRINSKKGPLFREVCQAVREDGVQTNLRELRLRLWLQRLECWESSKEAMDLLLAMVTEPDRFKLLLKEVPARDAKPEEIYAFLTQLESLYRGSKVAGLSTAAVGKILFKRTNRQPKLDKPRSNFPVITHSLLSPHPVRSTGKGENVRVEVAFDPQKQRWSELETWAALFIEGKETVAKGDLALAFDRKQLDPEEEDFKEAIEAGLETLNADYTTGKEQNLGVKRKEISDDDAVTLERQTNQAAGEIKQLCDATEEKLLRLANMGPEDPLAAQVAMARKGGQIDRLLNFQDCVDCLLIGHEEAYLECNPHLGRGEIGAVANLTLELLDLRSYHAQLKRVSEQAEELPKGRGPNDPERRYLCQKLYNDLAARYYFEGTDRDMQIVFRVFAGQSEMIPYKKQVKLITRMMERLKIEEKGLMGKLASLLASEDDVEPLFKDLVAQMMMGDGKTSVVAAIVMKLTAQQEGRFGLFVVPASLFDQVRANLGNGMKRAFNKDVLSIDIQRKDMNLYKLAQVRATLERAENKQEPILIKATCLQGMELELLSKARSYRDQARQLQRLEESWLKAGKEGRKIIDDRCAGLRADLKQTGELLKSLHEITELISERGDALFDEVDLVFDARQEVNFPAGERLRVDDLHNQLLHSIYSSLVRTDLTVNDLPNQPAIAAIVRLKENEQKDMAVDLYRKHVIPLVAQELLAKFVPFTTYVPKGQEKQFIRYVTDQMDHDLQLYVNDPGLTLEGDGEKHKARQADLVFLRQLTKDGEGKDNERSEAAGLVARARHFLCELIPTTLMNSGNQNYGLAKTGAAGKVIPYTAVDSPNITEYGYHWEWGCAQYQMTTNFAPDDPQILELDADLGQAAKYYQQRWGEKFEETAEYELFFSLFGIGLGEVQSDGKKLEVAKKRVRENLQKCLNLQYEMVNRHVSYHSERLTSGPATLGDLVATRRGMSGTPWNVEGYRKSMADRYAPDKGTMGRILHTAASRRAIAQRSHEIDYKTVAELLDGVCKNHATSERVRGIIDTAGQFRKFGTNRKVAKQVVDYLERLNCPLDPNIEGVLFFDRDRGQLQADTLFFWRKGAEHPERIGGTSRAHLRAKGLLPKSYFTIYGERQCTGTDIAQEPTAINIVTIDRKLLLRTIAQGLMRLRQFLFQQRVEFVHPSGESIEGIIHQADKVQTVRKARDLFRAFRDQIRNVGRRPAVAQVKKAIARLPTLPDTVDKWEEFFVTRMKDEPWKQHGRLPHPTSSRKLLTNELTMVVNRLKRVDATIGKQVEGEVKGLTLQIIDTKSLPDKWLDRGGPVGLEQETRVEVSVQKEIQVQTEIEKEVELELQRYDKTPTGSDRDEEELTRDRLITLISALRNGQLGHGGAISLKEQLGLFKYGLWGKPVKYENAFAEPIYGTRNFFYPCTGSALPVFHRKSRPPGQILAIQRVDGFAWLFVSEHEANAVKKHLADLYKVHDKQVIGVWFIQPDGACLEKDPAGQPFQLGANGVESGLLEINAFAGNAHYLDEQMEITTDWLEASQELKELRVRYLKLRVARNSRQNHIFRRCLAIIEQDDPTAGNPSQQMFRARAERERDRRFGTRKRGNALIVKKLAARDVGKIHIDDVKLLGIDWEDKEDAAAQAAIMNLGLNDKADADQWSMRQLAALKPYHLVHLLPNQVRWLPKGQVQYLTTREQIAALNKDQLQGMVEKQADLFAAVPVNLYPHVSLPWMVQLVPPEHLGGLSEASWLHLSKEQVGQIPIALGERLPQLQIPEKYGWIHGQLLDKIPDEHLGQVSKKQVQQTPPKMVPFLEKIASKGKIPAGTWTSWLAPKQILHIDKDQLPYLKQREQIQAVPDKWVDSLDPASQIPLISAKQVPHLQCARSIQACPNDLLEQLTLEQLPHVAERQISHLTPAQLYLLKEKVSGGRWDELRGYISKGQFEKFNKEQISALATPEDITRWMTVAQLHLLTAPEQIQACSSDLLPHLSKTQACHVSDAQLEELDYNRQPLDGFFWDRLPTSQVPKLNAEHLCCVPTNKLHALTKKQVGWLDHRRDCREQIPYLSPKQCLLLRSDDAIHGLSAGQVHQIDFNQAESTHPIWTRLTEAKVNTIGIDRLHRVPDKWLKHVEDPLRIQSLPWSRVDHLESSQLSKTTWEQYLYYHRTAIAIIAAVAAVLILAYRARAHRHFKAIPQQTFPPLPQTIPLINRLSSPTT